jgi:D-alanyl-D-alanine carboxypeptidase (penicillin-binding protein 5/6)
VDRPAPHISAAAWVVLDQSSGKAFFGRQENERREIASLTKLMNIYTVLRLCEVLEMNLESLVEVHPSVTEVIGTSANLLPKDVLTVHELLYGLMLPSGNDAAHLLAFHFGGLILDILSPPKNSSICEEQRALFKQRLNANTDYSEQSPQLNLTRSKRNPFLARKSLYRDNECLSAFIVEMNKNSARLGLHNSFFDSPHGLMNAESKSTALDTAKLAAICLCDARFVEIVRQKHYKINKSLRKNKRQYRWENTHKMLG